jgi:hypothetical protein
MQTHTSGEITLTYEADTERYHRYRGHKYGKEVTFYVKKHGYPGQTPKREIDVIINIEDKPKTVAEVNEERRQEKAAILAEMYGNKNWLLQEKEAYTQQMAAAGRAAAMKEINEIRKQQTEILIEIRDLLKTQNERTKNNPRRSAKKRS